MGKIHIYCGDGKGKTTACVGLSVRALGSGFNVIFTQFLKSGKTGEIETLKRLENVTVLRREAPQKFTFQMNEEELAEAQKENNRLFQEAISLPLSEKTLLVLDEAVGSIALNLLDKDMVLEFLKSNPCCEVVLSGRNPCEELVEVADYVSCIDKKKHPFDNGLHARKGIEF